MKSALVAVPSWKELPEMTLRQPPPLISSKAASLIKRTGYLISLFALESYSYNTWPVVVHYSLYPTYWIAKTVAMKRVMRSLTEQNTPIPSHLDLAKKIIDAFPADPNFNGRLTMGLLISIPFVEALAKEFLNKAMPSYIVEPIALIARSYIVYKTSQNLISQRYNSYTYIPCLITGWVIKRRFA